MSSRRDFLRLLGSAGAAALAASCGGGGGNSSVSSGSPVPNAPVPNPPVPPVPTAPVPNAGSLQSIDHIVFLMQENRSFDHYFGMMPDYRRRNNIPNADQIDGLPAGASNPSLTLDGKLDPANPIQAYHLSTMCTENVSATWNESHRNWNELNPSSETPTLDGFVAEAADWSRTNVGKFPGLVDFAGKRAMGFYTDADIPFYYALASQFAMSDRMFCSLRSHTQPNRMYLLAASSYGRIASINHYPPPLNNAVEGKTIFDLLDEHGITWKIYVSGKAQHPQTFTYLQLFTSWARMGGFANPRIVDGGQFAVDANNGTLPQVAMIDNIAGGLDEHPGNNVAAGASVVRSYFMALLNSPSWQKSAMILTYDEHGALYDHVPPPPAVKPDDIAPIFLTRFDVKADFNRYGFRVPFVLVSPWARKNFVSHVVADHTSILKLIETRFGLPSLTRRDAAAHDLTDMFDFTQMSWPTPPTLPEQPSGVCDYSLV